MDHVSYISLDSEASVAFRSDSVDCVNLTSLLAIMDISAVQTSAQTFIHIAICSLTPPTMLDTIKPTFFSK